VLTAQKDFTAWAKEMLAFMFKRDHKYAEADALLDEIAPYVDSPTEELSLFSINEYWCMRCQILKETGQHGELMRTSRQRLDFCLRSVGAQHVWTLRAVAELDWLYNLEKNVQASRKLREEFDFESTWDAICRKEDEREATLCHAVVEDPK
jgi:hypothetical protein